jgi:thioredoxin-like negative regulator of GroEL
VSETSNELTLLAPDVHWDEKQGTIYLRQRGSSSPDIPKLTQHLRQLLEETPDNEAVRFSLATLLLTSDRRQEAEMELRQVARSSDVIWSAKAQQLLDLEFGP